MADSTFLVERSITIEAPPARIYSQIADFHHWTRWSPWEDTDPELKRTYSGPTAGPGAHYGWSGNRRAGSGTMDITGASEPSTVEIDLAFEKPFKARNSTVFTIRPQGAGSQVTWSMTGKTHWFMRLIAPVVSMEKFLGPDFEKGLSRLKTVSEGVDPDEQPA